jgi:hypothetical protein
MSDDLSVLISEDQGSNSRSNELVWNVFSQLLVPLVILMTFVVVAELKQYQKSINEIKEQNQILQSRLVDIEGTDKGILAKRAEEQLIEAQQQKLLRALSEEIAERRGPPGPNAKGLDLEHFFEDSATVKMRGEID